MDPPTRPCAGRGGIAIGICRNKIGAGDCLRQVSFGSIHIAGRIPPARQGKLPAPGTREQGVPVEDFTTYGAAKMLTSVTLFHMLAVPVLSVAMCPRYR